MAVKRSKREIFQ